MNITSTQLESRSIQYTLGISEAYATSNADETIVTYSLGSCVGLALYDPAIKVGGMVHCLLPLSSMDPAKARLQPAMFADTGVSHLLQMVFNLGAERRRLVAKVAGASCMMDEKGTFRIGERNYTVLRKVLWKNNILLASEDVGGTVPRTLYLRLDSGRTFVRSQGTEKDL
ncbi:MAG: chemotaxis protein CheD [Planctomycetota bacterium]|nr:chemotaxis protein CheD [Planctomycetota bacterium]